MHKYVIKNSDGKFFEQDFAGWSWQIECRNAYKFKTLHEAEYCMSCLIDSGELPDMAIEQMQQA